MLFLLLASIAAEIISAAAFPGMGLHLAFPIALAVVFFGGIRLLPVVGISVFLGAIITQASFIQVIALPLAALLQTAAGVYLLQYWQTDPIFRKDRDVFSLLTTVGVISLIYPTLEYALSYAALGSETIASYTYVGTLFAYLIVTPFLLRWTAKFYFKRNTREIFELVLVFAALLAVSVLYFIEGVVAFGGVPFMYIFSIPFFIIALRYRPRFVTLAVILSGSTALFGVYTQAGVLPFAESVFQTQLFMIVTAITFLVIAGVEEHRRLNSTQLSLQVASLQNAVARISSESRAKNDFIAVLAHELRNPLSPVTTGIDLLRIRGPRDLEEAQTLEVMSSSLTTVRALLNDLLDVSRISEGKIHLDRRHIPIEPVIAQAVLVTDHLRRERHQTLNFQNRGQGLFVSGDAVRLEQVFSNLLTNASKYSSPGESITLSVRPDGTHVRIEVRDQGLGLDQFALETIFEPFQQIENGRHTKDGLGIGLALVRSFVTMHDGEVWAESDGKGKGSTFIVRLPVVSALA